MTLIRKKIYPESAGIPPAPKPKPEIKIRPLNPESKFSVPLGRMPASYTYGDSFPTCWLHHVQKQVF